MAHFFWLVNFHIWSQFLPRLKLGLNGHAFLGFGLVYRSHIISIWDAASVDVDVQQRLRRNQVIRISHLLGGTPGDFWGLRLVKLDFELGLFKPTLREWGRERLEFFNFFGHFCPFFFEIFQNWWSFLGDVRVWLLRLDLSLVGNKSFELESEQICISSNEVFLRLLQPLKILISRSRNLTGRFFMCLWHLPLFDRFHLRLCSLNPEEPLLNTGILFVTF